MMKITSHSTARDSTPQEVVVLVHGLAATRAMLRPLERSLAGRGYRTLNWGYGSIRGEIESLSETLARELEQLEQEPQITRFHLVTHSMGSILARAVLAKRRFARLGRVVMLGPPHGGSRVATRLARYLGWCCRPLVQLSDAEDSFVNLLAHPTECEIGIIAAARDRLVRIEHTSLTGQTDHIVVESGHTRMLFQADVAELVASFLANGCFQPQTEPATASI